MLTRPDEGWAWMVMVASFGAHLITGGFTGTSGIIHVSFLERFHENVGKTALAGTLYNSLTCCMGPLSGELVKRYSCRAVMMIGSLIMASGYFASALLPSLDWIILSYGVVAGIGSGLMYTAHYVVVGYNFVSKRNFATGVAASGCGFGTFVIAPLLQASRAAYGESGMFYICAGISLHQFVFGAMFFPSSIEMEKLSFQSSIDHKKSITNTNKWTAVLKNGRLMCLSLSIFLIHIGIYTVYIHFPEFVIETKSTVVEASYLVSVFGACICISRILLGMAANADNIDETLIYVATYGVLGLSTVLIPLYATSYIGQAAFAIIFGMYSSSCYPIINTLCLQSVGIKYLSEACGIVIFSIGAGSLVGPTAVGFIVDHGGTYEQSFVLVGSTIFLGATVGAMTVCFRKEQEKDCSRTTVIMEDIAMLENVDPKM